jgi:predicted membrane-bound spermidine synthase
MVYPAIVYNRDIRAVSYADNGIHSQTHRYQVTVIDRDPDSLLPDLVGKMPFSTRVRHFTTEGLHHDIFYVYF